MYFKNGLLIIYRHTETPIFLSYRRYSGIQQKFTTHARWQQLSLLANKFTTNQTFYNQTMYDILVGRTQIIHSSIILQPQLLLVCLRHSSLNIAPKNFSLITVNSLWTDAAFRRACIQRTPIISLHVTFTHNTVGKIIVITQNFNLCSNLKTLVHLAKHELVIVFFH